MCILLDLFRNVNYHILWECGLQISHLSGLFLLFLSLKTKKNSSGQIWQLMNPCNVWRRDESMGLTNTHKACGFSVLYHVYAKKQCILCSSLCHKCYLTNLCHITSRFILPWNFCMWLFQAAALQPHIFVRLLVGNETKYRHNNLNWSQINKE